MMNKTTRSISKRQSIWAAFLLAFAFMVAQPDKAQAQWVTNGNNINNTNTGNVGIGTSTPAFPLDVVGSGRFQGFGAAFSVKNTGGWTQAIVARSTGQAAFIATPAVAYSPTNPYWAMGLGSDGSAGWSLETYDGLNMATRMRVLPNGSVGIGTINPVGLLHLHVGSGDVIQRFSGAGNAGGVLDLRYKFESSQHRMGMTDSFGNWLFYTQYASPNTSATGFFPGNVGVGTTTPGYRLDVQGGQINASGGLCINGDCRTTWPTGSVSQWTTSGANIFYSSGNVGIGTTAPSSSLHVVGNVTLTGTGNISASGTITAGNIVAKYQDIAEWVLARHTIPAGTVVVLDIESSNQVIASQHAYDTGVAGVVSDSPGVILGEGGEGKVMVATTGRVRVKVDATRAPIRVGDILVTSDREGIAMRSEPIDIGGAKLHRPGTIIGKALEPLDKGTGEILVLLSLQ
ncbi:MAG: hypothetical protein WBV94_00935 [Blastocatellia bacterium]